jgi:hypothetical protein
MSANACEHFEESDHEEVLTQARSLSFIQGFDQHPSTSFLREYVACLEEGGVNSLRKQLIIRRGLLNTFTENLRDESAMEDKVIEILILL